MPRSSLVVLLAKFILIFICELLAKEHNQLKHHLFMVRVSLGNSLVFACYFFGVWFRFLRGSVGIPRMFLSRKNTLFISWIRWLQPLEPGDAGAGSALAFRWWQRGRRSWSQPKVSFLWRSSRGCLPWRCSLSGSHRDITIPCWIAAALTPASWLVHKSLLLFSFWAWLSKSAWFGKRLPSQHVTGNLFPGAVIWRKAERGTSSHSRARTQKVKYSCFRWQYKGVIYEKDWHRPKGLVGNMIITIKKTDYSPVANIQTFLQSVQTYKTLLL